MKLVVAVLALTLFGCAAGPRPSHYTVAISPMFSADEQEAIVRGLDSWTAAVKELRLDVSIGGCATADVCVMNAAIPAVNAGAEVGRIRQEGSRQTIELDAVTIQTIGQRALLEQTMAHELGHAMLGVEHTSAGTLMAAYVDEQSTTPTAVDVARWHEVR